MEERIEGMDVGFGTRRFFLKRRRKRLSESNRLNKGRRLRLGLPFAFGLAL